ncbi:hypothetical protein ACS0TY_013833 [Phlomoides rotata]
MPSPVSLVSTLTPKATFLSLSRALHHRSRRAPVSLICAFCCLHRCRIPTPFYYEHSHP